jgi:hypothetical protein
MYSIYYSVPSEAQTGSNLNVTVMLVVNTLTGLKGFVQDYSLTALLAFPNGRVVGNSVNVSGIAHQRLYPGGRWGPLNISISVTEQKTGMTAGQTMLANVTVGFVASVWNEVPVGVFTQEAGTGGAGSILVKDSSASTNSGSFVLPFILVVVGTLLLLTRLLVYRTREPRN